MLVVTNTIKVKEGRGQALSERFAAGNGVQEMPGFVRMEVWHGRPKDGADELKICTVWHDEESFRNWTSSETFRSSHRGAGGNEDILGASLDQYELLVSRGPGSLEVQGER